jgi:WD40 repeat protein
MIERSEPSRGNQSKQDRQRYRPEGHPVRVAFITWPMIICLGATVAAAACMIGDCGKRLKVPARETRLGHAGTVRSIAYRSDGTVLSSVGVDGSIAILDLQHRIGLPFSPPGIGRVRAAAFSPLNRVVAFGKLTDKVVLHDLAEGATRELHDPAATTAGAACMAFAPDGETIAIGQQDGQISLWDAGTGARRTTMSGHGEFVAALAFSNDGQTLATSGGDHSARVWELPAGRERLSIPSASQTFGTLALSPDGSRLALGDRVSPVVRIWDLTTGRLLRALFGPSASVVALAISLDGATLAAADAKGLVTFWELATLEIRPTRLSHAGVRTLAFAPDSRALATGGFDGTIRFWNYPVASVD